MASQGSNEGSSSGITSAECSDSTVQLNIKTLDSRVYNFQLDKNMPVSLLKEKIANEIGLPVGQQRLIFRGKVLKDEHVLSEYHIENGHTLHLVERQPNQSQASGNSTAEPAGANGNDAASVPPRNRVGQISHSVVLGTFNVGDQGEGIVPDLTRVIGAVLNSIGIGGQNTSSPPNATQPATAPPGNEAAGVNSGNQNASGNQAQSGQTFPGQAFQSLPHVVQIPVASGAIPIPSLNAPIPDSLNTLSEFINHMEQTLLLNVYQSNLSSTNAGDQRVELPTNAQGLPTVEALSTILHRTEQLLSHQAVAAISHIAGRLEREGTSSDLSIRDQIQSEAAHLGLAMQHLGTLLLELGRTILTLRMGQSPAESAVNAGPAVYISPSGPNPVMVQPFPLQTNSLFGGPIPSSTPPAFGAIGIGSAPRNVNIHIHAGTALAPIVSAISSRTNNGEGTRNENRNEPGPGDSGSARALPVRNFMSAAFPSHPPGVGVASGTQTGSGVSTSQPPPNSTPWSSAANESNFFRNLVRNIQGDNTAPSGQMASTGRDLSSGSESRSSQRDEQADTTGMNGFRTATASSVGCGSLQTEVVQTCDNDERGVSVDNYPSSSSGQGLQSSSGGETTVKSEQVKDAPSASAKQGVAEPARAAPLGLGMGGLERKRRTGLQPPVSKGADISSGSSVNQSQQTGTEGQHTLQALPSHGSSVNARNPNRPSQQPLPSSNRQIDMAGLMSQVLHSPALNGLLEGVSQQTGVDSPNGLRNMLQQFTQSPQMMNTVNQIVQQVGSQDMGNMFAGMERGQGGGIDFSTILQQMMPIGSRAAGGDTPPPLFSAAEPETLAPCRDENSNNTTLQLNLQEVVDRIDHLSPPTDVFRAVAENAVLVSGGVNVTDDILDELCSNESLASEYLETLRYDVRQRLDGHSEQDKS
ncbi:hypothetical protein HN51_015659 [Arachis hypogaea]|uniref:Ubiquitin-like domain-containing protein n=1 Tax=Arachis hypogaea TaxID=3818 RepID=A0A445CJJ2_ARAHY|nr:ubiquitin-like domain-containing protein CIP73 isoform X2 [Arachis hypogaea]QHO46151.1 Large proline-rich protein [Arachis hypogaea]RYR51105.1 hypothetical protein Ahy_A06g026163 isoform A [Arachis hypogaea]